MFSRLADSKCSPACICFLCCATNAGGRVRFDSGGFQRCKQRPCDGPTVLRLVMVPWVGDDTPQTVPSMQSCRRKQQNRIIPLVEAPSDAEGVLHRSVMMLRVWVTRRLILIVVRRNWSRQNQNQSEKSTTPESLQPKGKESGSCFGLFVFDEGGGDEKPTKVRTGSPPHQAQNKEGQSRGWKLFVLLQDPDGFFHHDGRSFRWQVGMRLMVPPSHQGPKTFRISYDDAHECEGACATPVDAF